MTTFDLTPRARQRRPRMTNATEFNPASLKPFSMTPALDGDFNMTPDLPAYDPADFDDLDTDEAPAPPSRAEYMRRRRNSWKREIAPPQEKPQVTYVQFVKEVRRQAMADIMPTPDRFNYCKPSVWDTAQELCEQFRVSWAEVAADCGLKERR